MLVKNPELGYTRQKTFMISSMFADGWMSVVFPSPQLQYCFKFKITGLDMETTRKMTF